MCYFHKFGHWREKFGVSAHKHRHGCQNWILILNRNFSRINLWTTFCFFSDFSRKLSKFLFKIWKESVGTALHVSGGINRGKLGFWRKKNFIVFSIELNVLDFRQKIYRQVRQNCIQPLQRNFLFQKVRIIFRFFQDYSGKLSTWQIKGWGESVGTALYVPRGATWRNHIFSWRLIVFVFCFWTLIGKLLVFLPD